RPPEDDVDLFSNAWKPPRVGLEPTGPVASDAELTSTYESGETAGGQNRVQTGAPAGLQDPDLRAVVEAWDRLPAAIRAGVLAMVRAFHEDAERGPSPKGGYGGPHRQGMAV